MGSQDSEGLREGADAALRVGTDARAHAWTSAFGHVSVMSRDEGAPEWQVLVPGRKGVTWWMRPGTNWLPFLWQVLGLEEQLMGLGHLAAFSGK